MTKNTLTPDLVLMGDELTEQEKLAFRVIKEGHVCLMRVTLNGVQRAAICEALEAGNGDVLLYPMALLTTEEEVEQLLGPTGDHTEEICNDDVS